MGKHENGCQAWESTLPVAGEGKSVASSVQRKSLQNQTRADVQLVARAGIHDKLTGAARENKKPSLVRRLVRTMWVSERKLTSDVTSKLAQDD